jgi:acetylornithine deacetylase/succinyl-diaminopimelate desuccinylase-like protein
MTGPVELLQQLVRIPSVNPDNPAGTDRTGEAALATFIQGWIEAIDGDVTLDRRSMRRNAPSLSLSGATARRKRLIAASRQGKVSTTER